MSESRRTETHLTTPIIFFHSGSRIPSHLARNLRHTRTQTTGKIILLCDKHSPVFPGVEVVQIEDWFDNTHFSRFKQLARLPDNFRDDFWNKAAKRFFALSQYAQKHSITRFLHVESDVLLLGGLSFLRHLDSVGKGLFYPVLSENLAISSVFYCNEINIMRRLLRHFMTALPGESEMNILGRFAVAHRKHVFGLPNVATELRGQNQEMRFGELEPTEELGFFDAAHIGQWLLGEDPRNRPGFLVTNQYVARYGHNTFHEITEFLRESISADSRGLVISTRGKEFSVRCIHVHSKALYLFAPKSLRAAVVNWASSKRPLPLPIWPKFQNYQKSQLKRRFDIQVMKANRFIRKLF